MSRESSTGERAQGRGRTRAEKPDPDPKPAPASAEPSGDKNRKKTRAPETRWDRTKANFKTLGGAILLALFIRIVLFEAFEIEGPSMEPTLLNGDRVVVSKFLYGLFLPYTTEAAINWGSPEVGDVIIVKSPADDIDIVKRVIGIPGDTVEIREDVVYRNGEPLPHRDLGPCRDYGERRVPDLQGCEWVQETLGDHIYRTSHALDSPPSNIPEVRVPAGHLYIMGDHRDRSNDSRFFGVVPTSRVKGKALTIYWSNDHGVRWDRLFIGVE